MLTVLATVVWDAVLVGTATLTGWITIRELIGRK